MKSKQQSMQQQNAGTEEAFHTEMQNGDARSKAGWFNDALQSYLAAVDHANTLSDKLKIADSNFKVGHCQLKLNRFEQALESFRNARIIYHRNKRFEGVVSCLCGESFVHSITSELRKSFQYAQKALILSNAIGDKNIIAKILWNISNLYYKQCKYQKAISKMQTALQMMIDEGCDEFADNIRIDLVRLYTIVGDQQQALRVINDVIDRAIASKNDYRLAFALFRRGLISLRNTHFDEAIVDYRRSSELFRQLGNARLTIVTHINHVSILYLRGDLETAVTLLTEANGIAVKTHQPESEIYSLRALAEVNFALNRHDVAFAQINQVIDFFYQSNRKQEECNSIFLRGEFYARSENYELATLDFEEAVFNATSNPNDLFSVIQLYLCAYWYAFWGNDEYATKCLHLANRQPIGKRVRYLKLISMIPRCMIRLKQAGHHKANHATDDEDSSRANKRSFDILYNQLCSELDALQIAPTCNIGFYRTHLKRQIDCSTTKNL